MTAKTDSRQCVADAARNHAAVQNRNGGRQDACPMRCFDAECNPCGNNRCRGKLKGRQFNGISPFYEVIAAQNMTAEHQRTDADQHIAKGQAEIFLHTQHFLNKRKFRIGTSSIYMAVINPALPAVVYTTPICWNTLPAVKNRPQQIPPVTV